MAIPLLATRPQVGASRIGDLTLSVDMSVDADDQYRLELQFADASGAPASPEELTVSATMPEHRMAPMPVTVERQADGRYLAVGKLESYGAWLFRIKTEGGEVGVPLDHPAHF
jgi:nitrogen fixation protein FixH